MVIERESAPGPMRLSPTSGEALAAMALGLRFIALAVTAASGAFLLPSPASRAWLVGGILTSALLGLAQSRSARRGSALPGEILVLGQVAVWIYLLHVSGGQRSPLFIGLLLEVPLTGTLLGRRGCVLAMASGAGAYLAYAVAGPQPLERDAVALVTGFIAVSGMLTWILLGILERQRAAIAAARAALAARAEGLATELRLLGDYLGGTLLSVDDLGRVASVNGAGAASLGIEVEAAVGRPWQQVLRPDHESAGRIARALADGASQRDVPLVFHRGDGVPVALRGEMWMSPSPDGRRMHLLLDQRPAMDAADDPVHRLGEAAACVAHQIKNSLHALRGLAHQAERDPSGLDAGLDARRFLGALQSLSDLTDDVLAVAGSARPLAEDVPLAQAVSSALLLARPGAVHVTVDPVDGDLRVRAPRGRLVHSMYNLIDNACRATPPGGSVRVHMERVDGCVHVEIVDGGPGLPPGIDGSRGPVPSRQGSGLGLLAARRFLESSGGRLSFTPGPAGGTVCHVTLPVGAAESVRPIRLERG